MAPPPRAEQIFELNISSTSYKTAEICISKYLGAYQSREAKITDSANMHSFTATPALPPSCPLSSLHSVLPFSCPASLLSSLHSVLPISCPNCLLPCLPSVQPPFCPVYLLYCLPCPTSRLSCLPLKQKRFTKFGR